MQSLSGLINSEVPVISCYHLIKLCKDIEFYLKVCYSHHDYNFHSPKDNLI